MNDFKSMLSWLALLVFCALAALVAPLVAFAVKAGVVRVPVYKDTNMLVIFGQAILFSGGFVLLLVFLSVFWHWGVAAWWPQLADVFVKHYQTPGCHFCGPSAWWNMLSEAWPYFLATSVTLFARGLADKARGTSETFSEFRVPSLSSLILVPIVAAIAFLLFLYGDEIIVVFERQGLGGAMLVFLHRWLEEITSLADPIIVVMEGGSFSSWLEGEVAKLHVSLFKLSALYPKVFWVFVLFGLGFLFSSRITV